MLSRDRRAALITCPKCGCAWSSRNVSQRHHPELADLCPGDYFEATRQLRLVGHHPRGVTAMASSTYRAPTRQRAPWLIRHPELYQGEPVQAKTGYPRRSSIWPPGYPLAVEAPV